jgi:transposase
MLVAIAVPGTPALTDAAWARVAPLLPARGRRGRPARDHRAVLAGILWVMRAGAGWREVPSDLAPWQTANTRYTRWRRDGTWDTILAALAPPVVTEVQL